MFADDLTTSKAFPVDTNNEDIVAEMNITRAEVHRWGRRNRVIFDGTKEHVNIIHPSHGQGDTFKFLGCPVDVKLSMSEAIDYVTSRARPKIKALLRSRPYYSIEDLIIQFKTHIWGIIEYSHGCVLHACDTSLAKIERLQSGFVQELRITEGMASLDINFAPLC